MGAMHRATTIIPNSFEVLQTVIFIKCLEISIYFFTAYDKL